jgi:hypothetical protein
MRHLIKKLCLFATETLSHENYVNRKVETVKAKVPTRKRAVAKDFWVWQKVWWESQGWWSWGNVHGEVNTWGAELEVERSLMKVLIRGEGWKVVVYLKIEQIGSVKIKLESEKSKSVKIHQMTAVIIRGKTVASIRIDIKSSSILKSRSIYLSHSFNQ